jgi:hypothetical protein
LPLGVGILAVHFGAANRLSPLRPSSAI